MDKLLEKLGKKWTTVEGLRNHSILIFFLLVYFIKTFPEEKLYLVCACFLALTIFYMAWKWNRSLKFVMFNKINVVFCFYNATKTMKVDRYLLNFESEFRNQVAQFNQRKIKVFFTESDRQIKSQEEATELIRTGYVGQTLLVWGDLTETDDDIKCKNTNFTYEFSITKYFPDTDIELIQNNFINETRKQINSYNWNLDLKRRLEIDSYVGNIKDIAIYTLARTLFSVGKIVDGVELLSNLESALGNLSPFELNKKLSMVSATKELLSSVYLRCAEAAYYKKNWTKMQEYLILSLKYKPEKYESNLMMSFFQEMILDDEINSKEYLKIAEKNKVHSQNGYMISKAYFKLKDEDFSGAVDIYRRLKRSFLDSNPVLLAENLREVYEKKSLPQYLFAEGFVKYVWLSESDGKARLKKFLSITEEEQIKYKVLRDEVTMVLEDSLYKKRRYKK